MTFSLIRPADDSAFMSYSDGRLHLLQLYQGPRDSKVKPRQHHTTLFWRGNLSSLRSLYLHYQRIGASLSALDPHHAAAYKGQTNIEIFFGKQPTNFGDAVPASGRYNLTIYAEEGGQEETAREINAQIERRDKDWQIVRIGGPADYWSVTAGSGANAHFEFVLGMGDGSRRVSVISREPQYLAALPIDDLADFIESTSPQASWTDPAKIKVDERGEKTAEERFEPWPLLREELVAALKEIERQWFAPSPKRSAA